MGFVRVDYRQEACERVFEHLRANGPAWSRELVADLHLAPGIIDEAIADLKGAGLVFRPERELDGGVTFDRWRHVPQVGRLAPFG